MTPDRSDPLDRRTGLRGSAALLAGATLPTTAGAQERDEDAATPTGRSQPPREPPEPGSGTVAFDRPETVPTVAPDDDHVALQFTQANYTRDETDDVNSGFLSASRAGAIQATNRGEAMARTYFSSGLTLKWGISETGRRFAVDPHYPEPFEGTVTIRGAFSIRLRAGNRATARGSVNAVTRDLTDDTSLGGETAFGEQVHESRTGLTVRDRTFEVSYDVTLVPGHEYDLGLNTVVDISSFSGGATADCDSTRWDWSPGYARWDEITVSRRD